MLSPQTIDWGRAHLRSTIGSYALIYVVDPGIVAKVGFIEPEEVQVQRHLAECGWALPVLGYVQSLQLPQDVSHAFCAQHGLRELPQDMLCCCCGWLLSVLLMPEADPAIWSHFTAKEVYAFMEQVSDYCLRELDVIWDAEDRHVAVYQGSLVALDLGNPEADCW